MSRENEGHTLQATALIHEVYLRLVEFESVQWQDRAHFFAVCARLMRRILIDFARTHSSLKRGGNDRRVTLDEGLILSPDVPAQLMDLEQALTKLAEEDPRKCGVVELRFFGGLDRERDCRSVEGLSRYGDAGLEYGAGLAIARNRRRATPCNLSAGAASNSSITRSGTEGRSESGFSRALVRRR